MEIAVTLVCDEDVYHYGYNGKTKDNEWAGVGNHYDFKFRGYDPRVGRFNTLDSLGSKFPWNASYNFSENRVIDGKDLEGGEWKKSTVISRENNVIVVQTNYTVKVKVYADPNVTMGDNDHLNSLLTMMKPVIEQTFTKEDPPLSTLNPITLELTPVKNDIDYRMTLNFEFEITTPDKIQKNDFVVHFVDEIKEYPAATGHTSDPGNSQSNEIRIAINPMNFSINQKTHADVGHLTQTLSHELGHTVLGAGHDAGPKNLMTPLSDPNATDLTPKQLNKISDNVPEKK